MLRPTNTGATTSALFEMKKGAAFSVRQDQQNDTQVFVILFWEKYRCQPEKNAAEKGRWLNASVRREIIPGSNRGRRSETAICIYGLKEEIRARKSPETVDAPGFSPDASIPFR